jgi:hypothetical protein
VISSSLLFLFLFLFLLFLLLAGGGGAAGMAVRRGITADMHKCKICMQTFPSTCKAVTLAEHSDSKHPKNTFAECFDVPAA